MLDTNFDRKANQLLIELAPAVLAAPAIPAGISKLAATIPLLIGLGTLGGVLRSSSKPVITPTAPLQPAGTIDLKGGVTIGSPVISPNTPEEMPPVAPETSKEKQNQMAPAFRPPEQQKLNSGELSQVQSPGITSTPSYSQTQAPTTSPSVQSTTPVGQQTQQQTQSTPPPVLSPGSQPQKKTALPDIGSAEEAYPVDYDLVPQAMNQSYRDTSRDTPWDVVRKTLSGEYKPVQQNAVPDSSNSPKEIAQRFKQWKKESDKEKYGGPGAFGGLLDQPWLK